MMRSGIADAKLLLSLTQKRQQFCLLLVLRGMQEFLDTLNRGTVECAY
jgi:hypothetical protein